MLQQFFDKVQVSSFEVASDAFISFKLLLTRHPPAVAGFLLVSQNYEIFFGHYNSLLKSVNYVTRRQVRDYSSSSTTSLFQHPRHIVVILYRLLGQPDQVCCSETTVLGM